jgi:hypothetical protein
MTICVCVRVGEGLVLAADSKVMLEGQVQTPVGVQTQLLQHFDFANKVTHFKDYHVGILNWGLGMIKARSIQSLIMEFEHTYPSMAEQPKYEVKKLAEDLIGFLTQKYDEAYPPNAPLRPPLGLLVGGYSSGDFFSDQYVVEFPTEIALTEVRPDKADGNKDFGANWYGMVDALQRLVLGYDVAALDILVQRGVDPAVLELWATDGSTMLPLIFDGMPLQDAIDFAEYAVQVVIGRHRFSIGMPVCGGEIDVAVITPSKFQWHRRKQWGIHHE